MTEPPDVCDAGVPEGPFEWRTVDGVTATEDFAFDRDGRLVSADGGGNLLGFRRDGTFELVSPGAGETRGLGTLPDGDIVFTNPDTGDVWRMVVETGGVERLTTVTAGVSLVDVASDGTLALGDLNGRVHVVDGASGEVQSWGRVATQLYGTTFSFDETRLFFASYSPSDPQLYVSDRDGAGGWSEPVPWTGYSAHNLAGMVSDRCGNLYAVEPNRCAVWRFDASGSESLVVELELRGAACYSSKFGQGAGWGEQSLYVATYDEVVEVDIGVPGR